jgi:hypothetical protein
VREGLRGRGAARESIERDSLVVLVLVVIGDPERPRKLDQNKQKTATPVTHG